MNPRRRCLLAPLLLCAVIFPSTAYARAPFQAHIRFRVPSTVTPLQTAGSTSDYVQAVLYWKPGASKTAGVSCCTNTIRNLAVYGAGGKTTRSQFPITMGDGHCTSYKITSRDGRGRVVGSVISDPSLGCEDAYVGDQPGSNGSFSGAWAITTNSRNFGGAVESSSTAGDSFTYDTIFGSAVAWVAITGPNHGSAKIYLDGVYLRTISTYSRQPHYRRLIWTTRWGIPFANHTVKIVNLATPGHPRISVDAMVDMSDD